MSDRRQPPPYGPAGPAPAAPGPGSAPPHLPPGGYGAQYPSAQSSPELIELSGSDLELDNGMDGDATDASAPIGVLDTLGYPQGGAPPPGYLPGPGAPVPHQQQPQPPMGPGPTPSPGPVSSPAPVPYNPGGIAPTPVEKEADIRSSINGNPQASGPQLLIIGGNNRGREYPLHFGDNSIGRGVDNDVILADIAVSRKHTIVCWENGQFMVRDLGSGNGTLYNGKRVDLHNLRDGDQLELGNTLLRFVCPANLMSPEVAEAETVVTGRDVPQQPMMAPGQPYGHQTEMAVAQRNPLTVRSAQGKGMSRTAKLGIFGGVALVLLFGLMIGAKLILNRNKAGGTSTGQQVRSPDEVAAEEFQKGTTQFKAREWEKAQTSFLKVLKLAPAFEQAKRYADRAAKEISAKTALEKAGKSLDSKDFKTARDQLAKIPSTSVYSSDSRKLKQKVDDAQVTALIKEARSLKDSEDTDGALAKIKEAKKILPDNQAVKDLYAELSGTASGTPPTAMARKGKPGRRAYPGRRNPGRRNPGRVTPRRNPTPRVKPIRVGRGKAKAAIKLYKQRQWAQAFNTIKDHAGSQTGARKRQAEQLADAIRVVARSWIRGERATKPAAALKYYQSALAADRKVGNHHQRELKKRIYEAAKRQATNSLSKKRYTSTFAAYKLAKKYGSVDPTLRRVMQALELKAQDYFQKGYTKRNTNIAYARKLWQQVLRMVPANNTHYQKAYQYLNSSAPSYQDEDED